jgi:hypothetical protein
MSNDNSMESLGDEHPISSEDVEVDVEVEDRSISSDLKVENEHSNPNTSFKSFNNKSTCVKPRFAISHKLSKPLANLEHKTLDRTIEDFTCFDIVDSQGCHGIIFI